MAEQPWQLDNEVGGRYITAAANACTAVGLSVEDLEADAVQRLVELVRFLDKHSAIIIFVVKHDCFRCEVCGNETSGERSDIRHSSKCPVPVALEAIDKEVE